MLLFPFWLCACSSIPIDDPDTAQLTDVATTAVGVSNGLAEANPVAAPMVNAGPAGWLALAAVKLGLNRIAEQQEPASCRRLLAFNTALGWGATVNNVAVIAAPPLALLAIPAAFGSYVATQRGSALRTCYADEFIEIVVAVPQDTAFADIGHGFSSVVANWPDLEKLHGTRPVDERALVHGLLIDDVDVFEQLVARAQLDWTVVGAWRQTTTLRPLRRDLLLAALATPGAGPRSDNQAPRLQHDPTSGAITLHAQGLQARTIARVPPDGPNVVARAAQTPQPVARDAHPM